MRKKHTRVFSMLLAVICLLGVMTVPAMASGLYEKQPTSDGPEETKEETMENVTEKPFASGETGGISWTQNENGDVIMEDGIVYKAVYPSKEAVKAREKALAKESAPVLRLQSTTKSGSVPPEVPQTISGSATVSWRNNGENSSYFKMSGFTGVPAGVGGDFSSATLHCADPTAAAPYEGMNCTYTATLTNWDASTGAATYSLYVVPPGATDGVSRNEFGLIGYQRLAGTATLTFETNGSVRVKKESSKPSVTSGDDLYSLAGANFQVYTDKDCTKQATTVSGANAGFTTDENGDTTAVELSTGTYYVKETKAPKGFKLNESVFKVTVSSGDEAVITVKDEPIIYGGVKVKKVDASSGSAQGNATLAGAEFTIYDADDKAVKTITTDASGVATTGSKDLIEGNYTVKETKAPAGYTINKNWRGSFTISENRVIVDLTKNPVKEEIIKGGFRIKKQDADLKKAQAQGDASISAAEYSVINRSNAAIVINGTSYAKGAVVMTVKTSANGTVETSSSALPYGTYEVTESKASVGYKVNTTWKGTVNITEDGKIVDLTGKPCEEPVIRGGVKIKKQDNDYKDEIAQGDASLSAAEFTITNKSKAAVVVGGKEYRIGEDVLTIKTNAEGFAQTAANALPYGTYEIRESKPSEGYLLNEEWMQSFEIRENGLIVDLTDKPCDEKVIRAGVAIEKRDKELDKKEALGGAWLSGIEFTITNSSNLRVWVDEKSYEPDEIITTIVTDEEGHASLPQGSLPYGTYTIQETVTNESYLLTDGEPRIVEIREDGKVVTIDTYGEELNFRNQVVRNDFRFNKVADSSNARMGKVAFQVTMLKTGEQHVIVTDRNGVYNSKSKVNPHSQNTNGNDFVLEKYAGDDDVIPAEELDYKAGLWFGLGQKGSVAEVQDGLGSLPYGEYRLQELRCDTNEGYKLLDILFYVETDQTVEPIIDLGTLTDDEELKPEIGTTAVAKDTETHETQADKETTIIDTVAFKNLKPEKDYTVYGKLMLVSEDGESAEELLYNGTPVTAEKTFTPQDPDGTVEMEFTFDSSTLAGRKTVVFEEVRKDSRVIAVHADVKDEGQTVNIIDLGTKAKAKDTGKQETVAAKETTIVDTVTYKGLTPKKEYTVQGVLMDKTSKKELLVDGKPVTAGKTFKPDAPDGTVELEFTFDSSALAGKEVVVFESLYQDDVQIATHADIEDKGQTVKITEPVPSPTPEAPTPTVTPTPTLTPTPTATPSNPSTPVVTTGRKQSSSLTATPVKTGDTNRVWFYLILMVVAGGAGILTAKFRNRKKK